MKETILFGKNNLSNMGSLKLNELFQGVSGAKIHGEEKLTPSRIVTDSRRVEPGSLFFAIPGFKNDGLDYIEEAIDRGALAVVSEVELSLGCRVPYIHVRNSREALASVAKVFYKSPDLRLKTIGITGTNGKTSVSLLCQSIINGSYKAGLIGTIHYDLGERTIPSYRTTPESVDIFRMLSDMIDSNCSHAIMEVSSHGLDQSRVKGIDFDVAVFMNLTHEHLDYHKDMDEYYDVKRKLFINPKGFPSAKLSVVNIDDLYGEKLYEELIQKRANVVSFGESENADLQVREIDLYSDRSAFTLTWKQEQIRVHSSLVGRYNVDNWMATAMVGVSQKMTLQEVEALLANFHGVPGRLQPVENDLNLSILVDYAHTPEALKYALETVRQICQGRLLVVFGCGGNRDKSKRELMTQRVAEISDFAWATSDNPRREKIDAIFSDMQKAPSWKGNIEFVEDRRHAIRLAIENCKEEDFLVIAGKGHETFQEVGTTVIPFDDVQVAREILRARKLLL
jgi:UDP-N-acetylmuramoyl-L-alanyl-D-glutamate--2,6-diaminopimelate ligase